MGDNTRCEQELVNGKFKNYLPINIEIDEIKNNNNSSVNLSKFEYDFKEINKVTVYKLSGDAGLIKGLILLGFDETLTAKFSTMGNVTLLFAIMTIKSINLYDGEEMDGELFLLFQSVKTSKLLCMVIPIKRSTGKSKQTNWFSQFGDALTFEDGDGVTQTDVIEVNNFTLNDVIPESEFIYYPNSMFAPLGCDHADGMKADYIIYPKEKAINIKTGTWENLRKLYGGANKEFFNDNLSDDSENHFLKKINWCKTQPTNSPSCMTVNYKGIYINPRGTKAGPGFNLEDDISAMTCEPIVDENDDPIDGRLRLSWLKTVTFGIPESIRNTFMLVVLSVILLGIVVVVHDMVFNKLGMLIGTESVLNRHQEK